MADKNANRVKVAKTLDYQIQTRNPELPRSYTDVEVFFHTFAFLLSILTISRESVNILKSPLADDRVPGGLNIHSGARIPGSIVKNIKGRNLAVSNF